ncbi:MAG: nucleotidyl transferase AbiEii/AbiGii toxin family protein, partial [Nanoarchaeota archaeon]
WVMGRVVSDFERFGIHAKMHKKREPYNSVLISLRVEGPLYSGRAISYAKIGVDINLKSEVILEAETLSYNPIYGEIPAVNALCMKPEEIFAEKVRALITRKRARDLFDLDFLIKNKNYAAKEIIEEKMKYYNLGFSVKTLISGINGLRSQWEKELEGFVLNLPGFDAVRDRVARRINELYR